MTLKLWAMLATLSHPRFLDYRSRWTDGPSPSFWVESPPDLRLFVARGWGEDAPDVFRAVLSCRTHLDNEHGNPMWLSYRGMARSPRAAVVLALEEAYLSGLGGYIDQKDPVFWAVVRRISEV